ncbi:MAG: hypothetical protein FJ009_12690 [Chloroflexi bacterium]|nr:hypothetical protein [Chloroflexota bacterium]
MSTDSGGRDSDAVIEFLVAAPRYVNPAIALYQELTAASEISREEMLLLQPRIDAAIQEGQQALELAVQSLKALVATEPMASVEVPNGF